MASNFFYNLGSTAPSDKCNPHTACFRHAIYMDATEHGFTATSNLMIIQPPELRSSACNYGVFDNVPTPCPVNMYTQQNPQFPPDSGPKLCIHIHRW